VNCAAVRSRLNSGAKKEWGSYVVGKNRGRKEKRNEV